MINTLESFITLSHARYAIELLEKSTTQERKVLSTLVPDAIKKSSKTYWDFTVSQETRDQEKRKIEMLGVVLYSTSNLTEIKKAGWVAIPNIDVIKSIFEIFTPSWINEWANWVLDDSPRRFTTIYPLVKQGYCKTPTTDNYILGMIGSINYERNKDQYLAQSIRLELKYLETDIWRLFEIEGGGEFSLSAHDKYSHELNCWDNALRTLSEEGSLCRDRLLDSCLEALGQDFAQFRAGWFSRFFTSLKPSLAEIEVRTNKLIFLIGSQISPTVSFALKNLHALEKKKRLPCSMFLDNVEPALSAKTKSTVVLSLKIIESLAKRNSEKAQEIALIATNAIIFDNAEVQEKVFDLLEKYDTQKNTDISEALTLNADFIVPSLQNRADPWLSTNIAKHSEKQESDNSPLINESNTQHKEIAPIERFEGLIAELSRVIEDPCDPISIERVLDGLSRIGRNRPADFMKLIGPLAKRASTFENRGPEKWLTYQLSKLVLSYINKENRFKPCYSDIFNDSESSFGNVFISRLYFLAESLLQKADFEIGLISAPTHGQGFINPKSLPHRIRVNVKVKGNLSMVDSVLAILRIDRAILGKHETQSVIDELISISTEFSLACAYALGADLDIGKTDSLWIAAACIITPNQINKKVTQKFGVIGPDAGTEAHYKPWVNVRHSGDFSFFDLRVKKIPEAPQEVPLDHISVLFHKPDTGYFGRSHFGYDAGLVKWGSTIWPSNLEPYFCCGACEVDITWSEAQWHVQSFFEPLLDSSVPLKPMALLLTIAGLSAKETGQKGIAIDIVIMSIDDERMDISLLGDLMAELILTGIIVVSRWTKAIKEIASISSRHAEAMRILIQSLLRFDPEDSPRELGGLIELLYELTIDADQCLDDTRAIDFFIRNKKGGKQGRLAKKMLQFMNK